MTNNQTTSQPDNLTCRPEDIKIPFGTIAQLERFGLGRMVHTPGLLALYGGDRLLASVACIKLGQLHTRCLWTALEADDTARNLQAIQDGERVFGAFDLPNRQHPDQPVRVWIITEADRSSTTVLLPDEY